MKNQQSMLDGFGAAATEGAATRISGPSLLVHLCSVLALAGALGAQVDVTAERIMTERSCLACHDADEAAQRRTPPTPAPRLDAVGSRLAPGYMRALLLDPRRTKPGTPMPDLVRGRAEVAEDLVHYLASRGGPLTAADEPVMMADLQRGRRLHETVGCLACHPNDESPRLARMTTPAALSSFLRDPLRVRPSGRMPSLALSAGESERIAIWLLRRQIDGGYPDGLESRPGLLFESLAGEVDEHDAELGRTVVRETGVATTIDLEHRAGEERFALRFRGSVEIETGGEYTFYTVSDDGSWLWVDGRLVVDNGGLHGAVERSGTVTLAPGRHALAVHMFERGGDQALEVSFQGPGIAKQAIPPARLHHEIGVLRAPDAGFALDSARVARGETTFRELGCAACHEPDRDASRHPRPLAAADAAQGCLATTLTATTPDFHLWDDERAALRAALADAERLARPLADAEALALTTARLGCLSCHERDGNGGPKDDVRRRFEGTAELGDEGRIPPTLTGVGAKLRQPWFHRVLEEGGAVRPYMTTRMPQFGAPNVADLPGLFAAVDGGGDDVAEPATTPELIEAGRTLVGRGGFSCITCHYFAGHGKPGYHAVDLAGVHDRITPEWHRRLLLDPQSVNPGTRMVPYFSGDKIEFPEILAGDRERQIEGIFAFLAQRGEGPLPPGLLFERAEYDLVPRDEPIVLGTFMKGLSARVTAIGYPEDVHAAFDVQHIRLAKIWRGGFINAAGTWHQRAGELQIPDSFDVLDMPAGDAFAILPEPEAAWPTTTGRESGWRMRRVTRDVRRRPIFHYEHDGVVVTEQPRPVVRGPLRMLIRYFRAVASESAMAKLWLRAAVGDSIKAESGRYLVDGRSLITVRGGICSIRNSGGRQELMVRLARGVSSSAPTASAAEVEVEISW